MCGLGFLSLVGSARCVAALRDNQAWFSYGCRSGTPGLRCLPWFGVLRTSPVVNRVGSAAVGAGCWCGAVLGAIVSKVEFSTLYTSCICMAITGRVPWQRKHCPTCCFLRWGSTLMTRCISLLSSKILAPFPGLTLWAATISCDEI